MTGSVDQDRLGVAQAARLHSLHPLIGCIDDFIDEAHLQDVEAELAHLSLAPARVVGADGGVVNDIRSAQSHKVRHDTLPAVDRVTEKVCTLFRLKKHLCEYPEFIHYEEGGEYRRHFDAATSGSMIGRDVDPAKDSQRILTAILYLNDDFSGGTTVFPRVDLELMPRRGRLAFWQNTKFGSAKVHHQSMHQGNPVTRGNKRIISFWMRDRAWRQADLA